ncbi:MAG TPA: alpha-mannosidase, partial [Chloroflexota bacterium]|nr:alpha-mannosidase [Chloroflexota bacterium]
MESPAALAESQNSPAEGAGSGERSRIRIWVVPHTHWDREWYFPFQLFRLFLVRTTDELMDVLEADPSFSSFTFDGQGIALEDYLEIRPEAEARLARLIRRGRIRIGPSYILP